MEAAYDKKDFYQSSMFYGTMLGIVWSVMYILFFAGVKSVMVLILCSMLLFSSPLFAIAFARKYRKEVCDDVMNFKQAWIFLFYMYLCASLFSAFIAFIYLKFIDGGTFFLSLQEILQAGTELAGTDEVLKQQMQLLTDAAASITPESFVWQTLNNNMFNASVLPIALALFVRKNKKNN